jgi:antitoxin component YwqK of YwqJK toxin-antitoxin module
MNYKFSLIIFSLTFSWIGFSQFGEIEQRRLCFQNSTERMGDRFVDWECGKDDRIVDCNERLETDPGSSIVVHRKTGSPYTGNCETCHENGIRERIVQFNQGLITGTDTTYYKSGCTQVVRSHIDGAENGQWTFFNDSSGLVAWKMNYLNGEKHGQSIYYSHYMVGTDKLTFNFGGQDRTITYGIYESDTLKIENHNNGRLHGPRKEYFPGSKLRKEVHYKEGVMHGPFLVYNNEDQLLQELNYTNGEKDGEWKYYYNSGDLLKTQNWDNGIPRGEFKVFFIQGHIQEKEEYDKKGRKHGWFESRFPDDKIKRKALYRKDELIEEHVFDEYGNEIKTIIDGQEVSKKDKDDDAPAVKTKQKKWWQFWKWFSK